MSNMLIELHLPVWLRPYEIFEVGTGNAYVDSEAQKARESAWLSRVFIPLGKALQSLSEQFTPQAPLRLAFSDTVLELLERKSSTAALAGWESWLQHIPWEGTMAAPGYSYRFLREPEAFGTAVAPVVARWQRLFGKRPKGIYLPHGVYANPLAFAARQQGFSHVWAYNPDASPGWYQAQHLPDMHIAVYGPDASQTVGMFPYTALNLEDGVQQCLACLKQHAGRVQQGPETGHHTYEWPYFEKNVAYPFQSKLQQSHADLMQKIKDLGTERFNVEMEKAWEWLEQAHVWQELHAGGAPWLGSYRNFSTAQDAYLHLMNVLADMELRVK